MTRAYQARATWSAEMVASLLDLRLGSLLPRFSHGRAPVQLQEAWNQLQSEFAAETGMDVSVQQLKNKYHQLKREYEETKRRVDAQAAASSTGEDRNAPGDGLGDAFTLPLHWEIVEDAFGKSDGLRGVSFFRRGTKSETSASPQDAKRADASPAVVRISRLQVPVEESAARAAATAAPAAPTESSAAATTPVRAAAVVTAGLSNASTASRRRSFPAAQPSHREWTSPLASTSALQVDTGRVRSGHKRPLASDDPQPSQQPAQSSQQQQSSSASPSAKVPKLDLAQALVQVGETIASAMVESARIVAASMSTGGTLATELAAKVDAQLENQTQMLQLLEKSNQVNEALLRALAQPPQQQQRVDSSTSKRSGHTTPA